CGGDSSDLGTVSLAAHPTQDRQAFAHRLDLAEVEVDHGRGEGVLPEVREDGAPRPHGECVPVGLEGVRGAAVAVDGGAGDDVRTGLDRTRPEEPLPVRVPGDPGEGAGTRTTSAPSRARLRYSSGNRT